MPGRYSFYVLVAFLLISASATAQSLQSLPTDTLRSDSEVRIGILYTSDNVYMGRSDSLSAPYISPSLGYYHGSGLFVKAAFSYLLSGEETRIDVSKISAGYDYYGDRFAVGLSLSEYFFSDLSYNTQGEVRTYLSTYAGYDLSVVRVHVDADLAFSENTDVFLGVDFRRTFYAFGHSLRIIPEVRLNAGSQHYYDQYYAYRSSGSRGKGTGHGGPGHPAPPESIPHLQDAGKFRLLDIESTIYFVYPMRNARIFMVPVVAFPINTVHIEYDQGVSEEELRTQFFWSVGARITL